MFVRCFGDGGLVRESTAGDVLPSRTTMVRNAPSGNQTNFAASRQHNGGHTGNPGLWVHTFDTVEDLRRGLQDFIAHYNATWLVARHGYRTPNQVRAEQRGLAQCPPANLPLAA